MNPSLDAAIKFRAIQDAYEVLSDPHTRTSYESARNSLLKKVIAQETMLTTGFVTQRDNFQAVKRGVSAGGVQESTNSRFKDAAWQKLPLAAKKAARTTNVRSGIAINLFALSVVGGVLFVDQCVIPRLSMLGSDDDTL